MGSSYSDLKIYLLRKGVAHGDGKYDFKTTKKFTDPCTNFEVVTHEITQTNGKQNQPIKPHVYNVLLYDGDGEEKPGKCVFGYYPSNENEMIDEVRVYFSIFLPENPFIITFINNVSNTYNCLYEVLKSAGWDYASNMFKYNFKDELTKDKLLKLYRSQSLNWKIQLKTDKSENVTISAYKEEIYTGENYRIIFVPKGPKSVLNSECLFDLDKTEKNFKCTKPAETKPQPDPNNNSSKAINQIDPYFLTSVKDHFFDGIIVYFYNNKQNSTNSSQSNGSGGSNANGNNTQSSEAQSTNCKHNMALLLEFIDYCSTKTQIKRIDEYGYCWSEETVNYNNEKTLEEELKKIKDSACTNESITFILEKKENYEGVKVETDEDNHATYKKYTHRANASDKPNIMFRRKVVTKIDDYDTKLVKTTTLEIYFLKFKNNEEDWPFIVMFNNEPTTKPADGGGNGGSNGGQAQSATEHKQRKKCFYFDLTNDFGKWHELKVTKKSEEEEEKAKEESEEKLDKKLQEKLDKIETNGKCQSDLYLLRSIAYYILNNDDVKEEEIKEFIETRPKVRDTFIQPGMGRSLPFILGSVFGGVFAIGILSAIIYGIYWYNTTIKLLT